jgi:hypothetical protein
MNVTPEEDQADEERDEADAAQPHGADPRFQVQARRGGGGNGRLPARGRQECVLDHLPDRPGGGFHRHRGRLLRRCGRRLRLARPSGRLGRRFLLRERRNTGGLRRRRLLGRLLPGRRRSLSAPIRHGQPHGPELAAEVIDFLLGSGKPRLDVIEAPAQVAVRLVHGAGPALCSRIEGSMRAIL